MIRDDRATGLESLGVVFDFVIGDGEIGEPVPELWDRLADLAIPDDEVENYAEALEAGRTIVAYHGSSSSVAKIEGLFRDGGLTKVKTF